MGDPLGLKCGIGKFGKKGKKAVLHEMRDGYRSKYVEVMNAVYMAIRSRITRSSIIIW